MFLGLYNILGRAEQEGDDEEEDRIEGLVPDSQYIRYIRKRQETSDQPISAFEQYDPVGFARGAHQQYGVPTQEPGDVGYEYPYPPTELGQSQTGYTGRHPSEELLPRAEDDVRRRAVYDTHRGRPLQGPANWRQYYPEWEYVGEGYQREPPRDQPLTDDEQQFMLRHGFTFERQIGSGGWGTVWKVLATRLFKDPQSPDPTYLPKQLACKVLSLKRFSSERDEVDIAVGKLQKEADLHKTLNHPNIVKCEHIFYIHDQRTGFPFVRLLMFMDLCDGDLKNLLIQKTKLTEPEAIDMLRQIAGALQYLHDQHIVHLDIKTQNIMYVNEDNRIVYKLGDFGVSKKFPSEERARVFGAWGTRAYMAPEMRKKKKMTNAKPADIYSLGCVLAEVVTGIGKHLDLFKDFTKRGVNAQVMGDWQLGLLCSQLITNMTNETPTLRPTIAQVVTDPWLSDVTNP